MNPQFKKGVLELCALTELLSGDKYGYELAEIIGRKVQISEGTVYPMLKRLQIDGCFESYLVQSPAGPARKYYRITQRGRMRQQLLKEQWIQFSDNVNAFLREGSQ